MNRLFSFPCRGVLALALACVGLAGGATAGQPAGGKPDIDLVICLDTSNSMDGLIESAKVRLWDIVNEVAKAQPEPRLRIALFTYGKAQDTQRSVQDVGMKLHAASGKVSAQAQSAKAQLNADKAVTIASTSAGITISAPNSILLTGGGTYLKIEGGNIELGTSGTASFKAAMKELAGAGSAAESSLKMNKANRFFDEQFCLKDEHTGEVLPFFKYRIESESGEVLARGITGADGKTLRVHTSGSQDLRIFADD